MLLEAEKLAVPLMDGLPRNAHDEAMDAWPTEPVALLPPLPRDLVRQQHSDRVHRLAPQQSNIASCVAA